MRVYDAAGAQLRAPVHEGRRMNSHECRHLASIAGSLQVAMAWMHDPSCDRSTPSPGRGARQRKTVTAAARHASYGYEKNGSPALRWRDRRLASFWHGPEKRERKGS
jgi:hypothetical protein